MPLNELALYYCPPHEKVICTQEEITNAKESRLKTFDQYKKRNFAVWITTLPQDQAKWKDGVCTCPAFFKDYLCKHILGLAIRRKDVKPPPAAKQIPIGQKRKRGRPIKATKALLRK